MITLVEARGFRCLRYVRQPLGPFHALSGPNGSGKSTFLEVIALLGAILRRGPDEAVREHAKGFVDLTWRREGQPIELAVEAAIPAAQRRRLGDLAAASVRYEIGLEQDEASGEVALSAERLLLRLVEAPGDRQIEMFPAEPATILSSKHTTSARTILNKVPGGNDNFYSETYQEAGKGWVVPYRLGARRSALRNLPEDESKFPVATWFKSLLADGVRRVSLDDAALRRACPHAAGVERGLRPDGSNLSWAAAALERRDAAAFARWVERAADALSDVAGVRVAEREDDRSRYLLLRSPAGFEVPSWAAPCGALRLLALTLVPYLPERDVVYLVEEPERGLDACAADAAARALAPARDTQILMETRSAAILGPLEPDAILRFERTEDGHVEIVPGPEPPLFEDEAVPF